MRHKQPVNPLLMKTLPQEDQMIHRSYTSALQMASYLYNCSATVDQIIREDQTQKKTKRVSFDGSVFIKEYQVDEGNLLLNKAERKLLRQEKRRKQFIAAEITALEDTVRKMKLKNLHRANVSNL